VTLSWTLPVDGSVPADAIRVYRSGDLVGELSGSVVRFADDSWVNGETYIYVVVTGRLMADQFSEGVSSAPLEVLALDRVSPGPLTNFVVRALDGRAFLTWDPAVENDVAGYRVYRRTVPEAGFERVGGGLVSATGYTDDAYQAGYAYAVSAVDRSGNEGPLTFPVD